MPTISIQRSLLIALLGLSTVVSSAQSRFDKWKFPTLTTKKGPNGLEGVVDATGKWVAQPYFDHILFPFRCYLGNARYKGSNNYYIIDPNFNIVGNGPYPFTYITPYYVIVRDYPNCYAINARGQRISDIILRYRDGTMVLTGMANCSSAAARTTASGTYWVPT